MCLIGGIVLAYHAHGSAWVKSPAPQNYYFCYYYYYYLIIINYYIINSSSSKIQFSVKSDTCNSSTWNTETGKRPLWAT